MRGHVIAPAKLTVAEGDGAPSMRAALFPAATIVAHLPLGTRRLLQVPSTLIAIAMVQRLALGWVAVRPSWNLNLNSSPTK
jgi:hypothetical protein